MTSRTTRPTQSVRIQDSSDLGPVQPVLELLELILGKPLGDLAAAFLGHHDFSLGADASITAQEHSRWERILGCVVAE